jgi:CubicO group peptidase (beta-lactamase class C family)
MKKYILIIWIFIPILLHAQSSVYIFKDGTKQFLQDLQTQMNVNGPGYAIELIYKDSTFFSYASGLANLEKGLRISQKTPFYIASVAKTMTAAAILLLSQEKKIQLQDHIGKYLRDLPANVKDIRIMNLLNHTSGLVDYYDVLGENLINFSNRDVMQFVRGMDSLKFDPGVKYAYSNTAYVLLAELIERISGESYSSFVKKRFFIPLQMQNTVVVDAPDIIIPFRAIGYQVDSLNNYQKLDYDHIYTTGTGGVYSTTGDLKKWIIGLRSGKFLHKRFFDMMVDFPLTYSGAKSYLGMGWNNESYGARTPEINGLKSWGSFGVLKGFRAAIVIFPDVDLTIIILGNSTKTNFLVEEVIENYIQKNHKNP